MTLRLVKRSAFALVLALLAFALVGCESARDNCVEAGGNYTQTGMVPITTYYWSGKVMIPVTNWVPTYACEGATQ